AKKELSGRPGVWPLRVSALSPRSATQSGSPTGATAASPSSAPRSTMVRRRGSRPSARASLGAKAQANKVPEASNSSRGRDPGGGKCRKVRGSPGLNPGRHKRERRRLRRAPGAIDVLALTRRGERAEREIEPRLWIDPVPRPPARLRGDIEPL